MIKPCIDVQKYLTDSKIFLKLLRRLRSPFLFHVKPTIENIMKLSIVIPHYNTSTYRERNLLYTIKHYADKLPNVPIIISEQITPDITPVDLVKYMEKYDNLSYVSIDTTNVGVMKSALINKAVFEKCNTEYIAMIDNDCVLRDVTVEKLLPSKECSIFIPYTSINFLREAHTRQLITTGAFKQSKPNQELHISRYTGGINVFSKEAFEKVGGFDEVFINWGAEDDAFHIKCKRLVGEIERTSEDIELLHLWHPSSKTMEYTQSKAYVNNKKRVACIKRMDLSKLERYSQLRGDDAINELSDIAYNLEEQGRLQIMVKVNIGNGYVTMDSTVYDIDVTSNGEVNLRDILECVFIEEGPEFVLGVISQIRNTITEIDTFSEALLLQYEEKSSVS